MFTVSMPADSVSPASTVSTATLLPHACGTALRRLLIASVAALLGVSLLPPPPLAAATPVQAPAAAAVARPGAETSGDSLFPGVGNRGYDVKHYQIKLAYSVTTRKIAATTTITAKATKRLSSFALDLEGLQVSRVRVDGRRATFRRHGDKLVITPARSVRGTFSTQVVYGGIPQPHVDDDGSQEGWIATPDGATALNEPVGAMTWYPNNNTPRDKATFTLAVTVPKALAVASNGDLARRRTHGSSTTWSWRQRRPMATYLSMISIGTYDVYRSAMKTTIGRTLPIWSFVDPKLGSLSAQRALIPQIVRFEERRFGPYPFTSVGIVVKNIGVGYALETQNRPFFDEVPDTPTLVHELAHQWYGDSVTPRDWGDIWLNEGFATYAEWLWDAAHGGPSTSATFQQIYDTSPASSELWDPAPADLKRPADLFSDNVYTRGAMTLEALRQRVGTKDFSTILRRWATSQRGRSVSTQRFITLSERASGRELSPLFRSWLYLARRPAGY